MEVGDANGKKVDLIDAMVAAADASVDDEELATLERSACPTCGSCSGMFTANSMNCLNEALGLALPGNGTIVATHANRKRLFATAAERVVQLARAYYEKGNAAVLPRAIATKSAFLNAMSLDIAMGGSTNTVLHLLAIAHEANVDFTMNDIDDLSHKVPCVCKVAPSSSYHVEDVHRAGGILSIMGALDRAGLLDTSVGRVDGLTLAQALEKYDVTRGTCTEEVKRLYLSAPAGKRSTVMGSQEEYYDAPDTDRENGCIRDVVHAYSADGGLAVLTGNISKDGSIIKIAGVDESLHTFSGPAVVFESQDEALEGILDEKRVKTGDVVVIRYEGPKGGPGMQEMLYPTSYLKARKLGKECALITDGRFSGGTSGLSVGHISPEAASGGAIALVRDGDIIEINIPARAVNVNISDEELANRRREEEGRGVQAFTPHSRKRVVSQALKVYAKFVTSADRGAVREVR